MKIVCIVEQLKKAIGYAERSVGKNLSSVELQSVLLIASGNVVKVRATNLSVGIEYTIPATVLEEGVVLIKGDMVLGVINYIPQGESVTLSLVGENLYIESQKSKTTIKSIPYEDFPTLPVVEGERFEISHEVLVEGIRSVFFASATTDIKPEIASVFIYSAAQMLVFVATDSFRLAEKKIAIKNITEGISFLLPSKNIPDIIKILESEPDTVEVVYSKNQISFKTKTYYITSRLIPGNFPDYRLILPTTTTSKVVFLKQDFLSAMRISSSFTDKFLQVTLSYVQGEGKVELASKNTDTGSHLSLIDAVTEGEGITTVFNAKYMLDVFQSLFDDSVMLTFTTASKPIIIKPVHTQDFLYLVMPVNR